MQAGPKAPGSTQAPVKIYNAVYSSVQVYPVYLYMMSSDTGRVNNPGLRVYGPRHRRYAKKKRFICKCDSDPQSCGGRQRTKDEDIGERNSAWET